MKRLLFVIVLAAAGWAGYWFWGSAAATRAFTQWFDARRAEGWVADYSDLNTRGFPSRFDTTITDLELADPDTGVAYSAPFVQFFALSYKPEHLIAVWPNDQTIASPYGNAAITSSDMRASLVVDRNAALALNRANFVATELAARMDDGSVLSTSGLIMAIERTAASTQTYHFGIETRDVILPRPQGFALRAGDLLPDALDHARGDITVSFDKPWDLSAVQVARPQPTQIDVELIEARWGKLELRLAGTLDVDASGRANGRITIKAQNWRDILALSAAAGLIPPQLMRTIEQGLSLLAGLSGNRNTLDLPLDFDQGHMKLGPIPLGPAPLLKLR